jgi:hypothetical protein
LATAIVTGQSLDQREVMLSSRTHNVTSEVRPGDRVWCYDPEVGLIDTANQVTWRGEVITPVQMRVASLTWPITQGMGVYLRIDGTWVDISRYVAVEEAVVSWEVTRTGRHVNQAPVAYGAIEIDMPGDAGGRKVSVNRRAGRADSSYRTPWTPSWTNFAIGTGGDALNQGDYAVADGEMRIIATRILGTSGFSVTGTPTLTIPAGWKIRNNASPQGHYLGTCRITCAGTNSTAELVRLSDTTVGVFARTVSGTRVVASSITATAPATWVAGNSIFVNVVIPVEPN